MTIGYVLLQNLRRNPLRTGLTLVAFALPMAIFVAAISLVVALIQIGKANAKELRMAVHHKTTIINMLPEGTRKKVEALDPEQKRLLAVCGMRWFGGKVPNTPNVIQSLAADEDTFPIVYTDADMSEADQVEWKKDKQACVVGFGVAETYHWSPGQRIVLQSSVPPYLQLEFHIIKILATKSRANVLYFRRDLLAESLKEAKEENYAACNIFWVKCRDVESMRSLQTEIDASFANSPNETKSEDENAFAAGFAQAAGNLPGLMQAMAIVVVVIIALVAGNTMMMSFRDRTRELAVFKAIGFQNRRIFLIVLGESVALAMFGALIGVLPTAALLTAIPIRRLGFLPISALTVSPAAIIGSLVIALLVGLAAGITPAIHALRLRTVDALRNVA
jgi:putative ABC transport system permease protein